MRCEMQVNPSKQRRVMNFDSDLRDGNVIASVLRSHVPDLKAIKTFHLECETVDQVRDNARKVHPPILSSPPHLLFLLLPSDAVVSVMSR